MVAGQNVELVLAIRFPQVPEGAHTSAFFTIADRDGVLKADGCTLAWEHANHAANDAQPCDPEVDRAVTRPYAARVRQEAVAPNRTGHFTDARQALHGVATRIESYAGDDTELRGLVAELKAEEADFSVEMDEILRKSHHFRSSTTMRSRDASGRAKR